MSINSYRYIGIRYLYITAAVTGKKKVETSKRKVERKKNLKTKRLKFKKYTKRRFLVKKKSIFKYQVGLN